MSGVVVGMTTMERAPAWVAAYATPCAWLPALAVIDAAVKLLLGELRDLVVRAAQLVGAGALHVLGLEPHAVAGRRREVRALNEFRLERDLFDFLGCLLESLKCEHLWHRDPYLRKGRDGVLQRVANLPRTRT